MPTPVYFGSILLEAHRWAADRTPTYCVSEWLARVAEAGFDGVELWENHGLMASDTERAAMKAGASPIAIFNSYATMDDAGAERRQRHVELVRFFGAKAVKFNVTNNADQLQQELATARAWGAMMPGVQLLCECHPGTSLEDPATAAAVLADWPEISVIAHAFIYDDLCGWMQHLGPRTAHIHAQACNANRDRIRLRDQAAMSRERLAILRDGGFSGSFTIEFTAGISVQPEDREFIFAAAVDDLHFLREEW